MEGKFFPEQIWYILCQINHLILIKYTIFKCHWKTNKLVQYKVDTIFLSKELAYYYSICMKSQHIFEPWEQSNKVTSLITSDPSEEK